MVAQYTLEKHLEIFLILICQLHWTIIQRYCIVDKTN